MLIKNKLVQCLVGTLFFLILSLTHVSFEEGGGFLFSSPTTVGRGYPLAFLVWELRWPDTVSESLSLEELAFNYTGGHIFRSAEIPWRLGVNVVFWFICSYVLISFTERVPKKKVQNIVALAALFTVFSFFLKSVDTGLNEVTSRGAPFAYLTRYFIPQKLEYSSYQLDWFYLVLNLLFYFGIVSFFTLLRRKVRRSKK